MVFDMYSAMLMGIQLLLTFPYIYMVLRDDMNEIASSTILQVLLVFDFMSFFAGAIVHFIFDPAPMNFAYDIFGLARSCGVFFTAYEYMQWYPNIIANVRENGLFNRNC